MFYLTMWRSESILQLTSGWQRRLENIFFALWTIFRVPA